MAARVNFRFLLILIIILGAVGGGIGAVVLTQEQTAAQFLAKAQELEDAGNLKAAQRQLEQAIGKEPRNIEALDRMEALYEKLIPQSQSEAIEFFPKTVGLRTHRAIFFEDDAEAQRRAIAMCRAAIRYSNATMWWDAANEAAGRLMRIDDPDARIEGTVMRGLWLAFQDGGVTLRADRTADEREEGRRILRELVADHPTNDHARAALIRVLRSNLRVLEEVDARQSELERAEQDLILAIQEASDAMSPDLIPDGELPPVRTWTAIAEGWVSVGQRRDDAIRAARAEGTGVEEAQQAYEDVVTRLGTTIETLISVAEAWATSAPVDPDGDYIRILSEATDPIVLVSPMSPDYSAARLFQIAIERDGTAGSLRPLIMHAFTRAWDARRFGPDPTVRREAVDAMRAAVDAALAAGPQSAGIDAMVARDFRRRAHILAVETELLRFEGGLEADRSAALAAMQTAEAELRAFLTELGRDADESPGALFARGLVRFAEADNTATASLLGQVIDRDFGGLDRFQTAITTRILAQSLEREGALPRAARLYEQALESVPNDRRSLLPLINIRIRLADFDGAGLLVDRLEQVLPDEPAAANLVAGLRRTIQVERGGESDDPVAVALREIQDLEEAGRVDEALARADELAASDPARNIAAVHARIGELAQRAGDRERARDAFMRAIELEPGNPMFQARLASVATEDPIEQRVGMVEAAVRDPAERAAQLVTIFEGEIRVREGQLEATTDAAEKARLEAEIDRFETALAEQEAAARAAFAQGGSSTAAALWMARLLREASANDDWTEAEAFLATVQQNDLDRAGGSFAEGQLMLARSEVTTGDERTAFLEQAVAAFTDALEVLPFSESVARLLGVSQRQLGRTEAAVRAFAQAMENAPGDPGIAREYCQALVAAGQRTLALEVAAAAVARNPDDRELRELRLALELDAGNAGVVLLERRQRYASSPNDRDNALRYAYLLLDTPPTFSLMVDADGRPVMTPGEWSRMGATRQQARRDVERRAWIDEARSIIAEVAAATPDDPQAGLGLAILRAIAAEAAGDGDGAVEIVRDMVASADDAELRPATVAAGASLLVRFGRVQDAVNLLVTEQEQEAEPNAAVQWQLGQIIRQVGRPEIAAGALQGARRAAGGQTFTAYQPMFANLFVRAVEITPIALDRSLVELLLQAGAVTDARTLWDEWQPHESRIDRFTELAIVAREADLARLRGDQAAAEEREAAFQAQLEPLRREDPSDPRTWRLEIERLVLRNRLEGRAELLDQAVEVLAAARMAVAESTGLEAATLLVYRARGNFEGMATELEAILEERPAEDGLREQLVDVYLTLDRSADAERVTRAAIELYGSSERGIPWLLRLGGLQSSQGDHAAAAATFGTAVALTGGEDLGILRRQVRELLSGDAPRVRQVASLLAEREPEMARDPGLRAIYGRSLLMMERTVPGEEQFARSLADMQTEIDAGRMPASDTSLWVRELVAGLEGAAREAEIRVRRLTNDDPDPWMLFALAQAYAGDGPVGRDRGLSLLEEAIAATPGGPEAAGQRAFFGKAYGGQLMRADRPEAALAAFERALEDAPRDAELLNNAAFLQATVLGDPEGALPKALNAVSRMPDNWAFLDTAGKICSLLERWDDAESYLRRSIAAEARATNIFHLAEVLAATDRRTEALRLLEDASEVLEPTETDLQDQINRLADQLAGG
jgi:tetratricopeptide (TPR) repeat protein